MQRTKRTLSLLFVLMMILTLGVTAFAAVEPADGEEPKEPLTITAETNRLQRRKTLQLTVNTDNEVTWSSSDEDVAVVDENGLVKGKKIGHAHITAEDETTGESAQYMVYVVRSNMPWRTLLEKQSVLGYRYKFEGDFYYTDDLNCWQKFFGWNTYYDYASPFMLMEYDFTRITFNYEGKEWLVQMWKGQYGAVFYGSEVGVYNKPEGRKNATPLAQYAAAENDRLKIGTELYRKNFTTGEYDLEFTTDYEDHWWATGFVPGHLWNTKTCSELRLVTHITFKDEEMATLFAEGMKAAENPKDPYLRFEEVDSLEDVRNDTFYRDGADVYLQWQNINEATNSKIIHNTISGVLGFGLYLFLSLISMVFLVFGGVGIIWLFLI